MAWIEQTGKCSWRVRYPRPTGGYGSISGFSSRKTAHDYADDLESDRRRGQWLDPDGAKTSADAWAARWVETLDGETHTEENYGHDPGHARGRAALPERLDPGRDG